MCHNLYLTLSNYDPFHVFLWDFMVCVPHVASWASIALASYGEWWSQSQHAAFLRLSIVSILTTFNRVYFVVESMFKKAMSYLRARIKVHTPHTYFRYNKVGKGLWALITFSYSIKMQLFLRAQNTHTLEVTGQETVADIKVNCQHVVEIASDLFLSWSCHLVKKPRPWITVTLWCPSGSCPDSGGTPGRGSGPVACRVPTGEWCLSGILRCLRALHFGGSWQTSGRLVYSSDCIKLWQVKSIVQLCFCTFEIPKIFFHPL